MTTHWLHLYEKPAQGNKFLKRFQAFNYRHTISAVGGFDTASCALAVSRAEGELFLERYIGNRVAVYVDHPILPVWEGFIQRIALSYGEAEYRVSLDGMGNRVRVFMPTLGALTTTITTQVDNSASQAIYGVLERAVDAPPIGSTSSGIRTVVRDKYLAKAAYPQASAVFRRDGEQIGLRVEMLGFYHTLLHDIYTSTNTTAANASVVMTELVTGNANGTTFFDDTDTRLIQTNATFTISREATTGITRWQFMQQIQEAGDGVYEWIMGITPTDPNTGKRRFYYQQANSGVEYQGRLADGLAVIRTVRGGRVQPWEARPDRAIRLQDALIGWNLPGSDPRTLYIGRVDYDGERGTVVLTGADHIRLDGEMALKQVYQRRGRLIGGLPRALG